MRKYRNCIIPALLKFEGTSCPLMLDASTFYQLECAKFLSFPVSNKDKYLELSVFLEVLTVHNREGQYILLL